MKLSIIIPTYNEAAIISSLLTFILDEINGRNIEVILVDGGSQDDTFEIAKSHKIRAFQSPKKGRAWQLNYGAAQSSGDILYFLHADTIPPVGFIESIIEAEKIGYGYGCFPFKFQPRDWRLYILECLTTLPFMICRGGDQSLFIGRELWLEFGPFPEIVIMEEYVLLEKLKKAKLPLMIMDGRITVSKRKYDKNGFWPVQYANFKAFRMFKKGAAFEEIADFYATALD